MKASVNIWVFALTLATVVNVTGCGCSGTGLEGTADGEDTEGEPDDPGTTDVPSDAESEPEVPTVLPECGESSEACSYFTVDGTDWAREPTFLDLVCDLVATMNAYGSQRLNLHCFSEEGVESHHQLAFGALPALIDIGRYVDEIHAFRYLASPALKANRCFSFSSTRGELEVAGIDADSLLEGEVYLGPISLEAIHGSCETDDGEMGDTERIAVRVSCGSTVAYVFDGNMVDLTCPSPYRVYVDKAVAYHSPEEIGPEWPDKWFSVLIVRGEP